MRIGMRVLIAAAVLGASAAAALAEGPYDNSPSYWTRVERWQDCAWKAQGSPYPPAFSYGPTHSGADGRTWIAAVQQAHAAGRPRRFAIALKDTDRIIGGIALDGDPGDDTAEPALGYWLGQPYWRRGFAREAVAALLDYGFRTLGL